MNFSPARTWYDAAFYLLHLDHHTRPEHEVGRDADPDETARLLALSRPDAIQIHAKGNPGWTTYPSEVGHTPPLLKRDVIQIWSDIARQQNITFSAYYNLGRDAALMKSHPQWNRQQADGSLYERALCYISGVAKAYLWPQIEEIIARYRPGGFWFDGACFTVQVCYCPACRARFQGETGLQAPADGSEAGWDEWKEMHRQIFREFVLATCARIRAIDPDCLVCVNFAYSMLMPESVPDGGPDYLSGDRANEVESLSREVRWYDGLNRPFDFMTALWRQGPAGREPKAREQIEQEMAIIIANGAKFFVWDNPSPESGLDARHLRFAGEVIAPFLRPRQFWCQNTRRVPTVSLLNSARDHYAATRESAVCFPGQNKRLEPLTEKLRRNHLDYEMVSDARLQSGEVRSKVLLIEPVAPLADEAVSALRAWVEDGGTLLINGGASGVWQGELANWLGTLPAKSGSLAPRAIGRGCVWVTDAPLAEIEDWRAIVPLASRPLWSDAPGEVELAWRAKNEGSAHVLHAVNRGAGHMEWVPNEHAGFGQTSLTRRITGIAPVEPFTVSVALERPPARVTLAPQGQALILEKFEAGRCQVRVPGFSMHQMVVFHAA